MLGKIVYNAHLSNGKVLHDYWKLKAIESIEASSLGQLPKEEFIRLIDTLIDNHEIKIYYWVKKLTTTLRQRRTGYFWELR